ncbi:MAG TPA: methyltransferase domain-containing protein [Clostridia bacterium]|nr:methyltransferase domain-containing protein [Clostridia bacterium]
MIENMSRYNEFAEVYDLFMEDVDYKAWSRYVEEIFGLYGIKPGRILDTACGTGNITIPLSKSGYELWGLDLSEDMLSIAESKARTAKQKIRLLNQDMTQMNLKEKFEAVLCMCDGVNYILDEERLSDYFNAVYKILDKNGIFVFDVSSYNKIRFVLGNNTFHEEKDNKHYIWNNNFNESSDIVEMELIFFMPQGSLYRKFEEHHSQKAHKSEQLINLLEKAGFENIRIFEEFSFNKPTDDSERIFFAAVKNID